MFISATSCTNNECNDQRDHKNVYRIIAKLIYRSGFFCLHFVIKVNHQKPDKESEKSSRPIVVQKPEKQFHQIRFMFKSFKYIRSSSLVNKSVINKIHPVHS